MEYSKTILLKDGRASTLRNGTVRDAEAALENFIFTHARTGWLFSYPDEITLTV